MTIQVTREHIRDGVRRSSSNCPIAKALRDSLGKEFHVGGRAMVHWMTGENFVMPEEAQRFAYRFDHGYKVEPFSFEMPEKMWN